MKLSFDGMRMVIDKINPKYKISIEFLPLNEEIILKVGKCKLYLDTPIYDESDLLRTIVEQLVNNLVNDFYSFEVVKTKKIGYYEN